MFYSFDQNNSGGYFDVDDKVCHRIYIEADSEEEAIEKAEYLGCYWDGVESGIDCPCCGDRWSKYPDEVNIEEYNSNGYEAYTYCISICDEYKKYKKEWEEEYGRYEVIENPTVKELYGSKRYSGKIRFKNIEEYAQYISDNYGWTSPDARIYYKDGNVKEIFSNKN